MRTSPSTYAPARRRSLAPRRERAAKPAAPAPGGPRRGGSAGYSGTPLAGKLGIKAGSVVHPAGAPEGYRALLEPLPDGVTFAALPSKATDIVHLFAASKAELARALRTYRAKLGPTAAVWVSWPKKRAKTRNGPKETAHDVTRTAAKGAATKMATKMATKATKAVDEAVDEAAAAAPSDVTEHAIREVALPLGFVDVKVCAVDETWSALKLVVRKELR